jgi:hypothetical protein
LRTNSDGQTDQSVGVDPTQHSEIMSRLGARHLVVLLGAVLLAGAPISAQSQGSSPDQKPAEQKSQAAPADAAKAEAEKKRSDEIAEAGRVLSGPAANPECVWLGRRVVRLLSQDDLDTAFRHLDLFDRFGCPGNHIQATFRCLILRGTPDPKATETLNARVHSCWINPAMLPSPPTAAAPPAASGTTTR